eukprot:TRINITY_DN11027_c0_g1_i1.p1 TRINITY_DN11027_c0_g1~~TRINITY_DN11027_c0_g1_i1.p1  ORF type:complete len:157 (+),score=46.76 TRINITY_DN11027_c0_g1_i1:35-505(+)
MLFFFFQAEDGIRDLVRSRGLGDVYKRQYQRRVRGATWSSESGSMADTETNVIWFLAQLKPNCARIAVRNLERQGFRTFLPLHQQTIRRETRFANRTQPLFPGYLFVAVDAADGGWSAINGTQGVTRLVGFGSRPAQVPNGPVSYTHLTLPTIYSV